MTASFISVSLLINYPWIGKSLHIKSNIGREDYLVLNLSFFCKCMQSCCVHSSNSIGCSCLSSHGIYINQILVLTAIIHSQLSFSEWQIGLSIKLRYLIWLKLCYSDRWWLPFWAANWFCSRLGRCYAWLRGSISFRPYSKRLKLLM